MHDASKLGMMRQVDIDRCLTLSANIFELARQLAHYERLTNVAPDENGEFDQAMEGRWASIEGIRRAFDELEKIERRYGILSEDTIRWTTRGG